MQENSHQETYLVGIGASAGGLEALEIFFSNCPADAQVSFVVIQHLSPDFKSLMDELLARHTSLPIKRVDSRTRIDPGHIYLIPPKKNLDIAGDFLVPTDFDVNIQPRLPIDHFFTSLGESYQSRAIGVILSGTGSDGTKGAAIIKERGGLVLAQTPESCKFDSMPKSIIREGLCDRILNPDHMADLIVDYTESSSRISLIPDDIDLKTAELNQINVVLEMLHCYQGIDFSSYRLSTIARRIERRVKIHQIETLEQYIDKLKSDPFELKELQNELLIGVTRFFRDKEVFDSFREQVIPQVVSQCERDTVRIWVVGCSTGEEAYSIAMLFLEYFDEHHLTKDVKIFATDADRNAVQQAATGVYTENIVADVSPERLEKFFKEVDGGYEVSPRLRRTVLFSCHNCVTDPPFTKIDVLTCRNVLIYFQSQLQAKALSLFHFALRKDGYLLLGKSEALGELDGEFHHTSPSAKIYRKLRDIKLAMISEYNLNNPQYSPLKRTAATSSATLSQVAVHRDSSLKKVYDKLLDEFIPPCILIDQAFQIQHVFGAASDILSFPIGKTTYDIHKMVGRELSLALGTMISRSNKSHAETYFRNVIVNEGDQPGLYDIRVRPFDPTPSAVNRMFLVFFNKVAGEQDIPDLPEVKEGETYDSKSHTYEEINNLKEQLQSTRESLQATVEELETTNEELQSTNEELMSSNEELQSSNEELQSVNEELQTVNAEYEEKIEELTDANRDIDFLVSSNSMAILFLDDKLRVKRFSKGIRSIINLMPHDVERVVTDLTFVFAHDAIVGLLGDTLKKKEAICLTVNNDQTTYLVKASPYLINRDKSYDDEQTMGIVLSFLNYSLVEENWGLNS